MRELEFVMSDEQRFNAIPPEKMFPLFRRTVDELRAIELKQLLSSDWFKKRENLESLLIKNILLENPSTLAVHVLMALDSFKEIDLGQVIRKIQGGHSDLSPEALNCLKQLQPDPQGEMVKEIPQIVAVLKRILGSASGQQSSVKETISTRMGELEKLKESASKNLQDFQEPADQVCVSLMTIRDSCKKSSEEEKKVARLSDHVWQELESLRAHRERYVAFYGNLINYWSRLQMLHWSGGPEETK